MQAPDDVAAAHRWFAVEANNAAWDVLDGGRVDATSTSTERRRLLATAWAAAWHWDAVGGTAERARALHLLARVALEVGDLDGGLAHARECHALVTATPDQMAPFDLPLALEVLARATAAAGDRDEAGRLRARAVEATVRLADPGDREVVEGELARGPWFGLDTTRT